MLPKIAALAIISSISLFGCCTTPGQPRLPLPPPIQYPTVKSAEMACLSDQTYLALVERDSLCRARVRTLENIIKSTH